MMNTAFLRTLVPSLISAGLTLIAHADTLTADQLLQNGRQAWNKEQCVQVGEYLFAYQQLNPPALQADANHRSEVATAIRWCEQHATVGADIKADKNGTGTQPAKPVPPQLGLSSSAGNPNRRCDIYARLAVAQNEANVINHCGLSGNRWVSDYAYHYNYCVSVQANVTAPESSTRTNMLNACAQ